MECQIETNNFPKLLNASIHDISELDCCSLRDSNCNNIMADIRFVQW